MKILALEWECHTGKPELGNTNISVCILVFDYRDMSIKFGVTSLAVVLGSRKDGGNHGNLKLPCLSYCMLRFHM